MLWELFAMTYPSVPSTPEPEWKSTRQRNWRLPYQQSKAERTWCSRSGQGQGLLAGISRLLRLFRGRSFVFSRCERIVRAHADITGRAARFGTNDHKVRCPERMTRVRPGGHLTFGKQLLN